MTFVGHVPNALRASEASTAGQKSIEHIFYSNLTFDCSAREEELRRKSSEARAKKDSAGAAAARDEANASFNKEKADTLWKTFVSNRTWVVPTLVAMRTIAQQREAAKGDLPGLAYMPPALRQSWAPNEIEKQVSPEVAKWYLAQFQNDMKLARAMHDAGVQMMAGSDSLDPFNFPGPSLHDELQLLTEVGFTPLQALQAATSNPPNSLRPPAKAVGARSNPAAMADWFCSRPIHSPISPTPKKSPPSLLAGNFLIGPSSTICWTKLAPQFVRPNLPFRAERQRGRVGRADTSRPDFSRANRRADRAG